MNAGNLYFDDDIAYSDAQFGEVIKPDTTRRDEAAVMILNIFHQDDKKKHLDNLSDDTDHSIPAVDRQKTPAQQSTQAKRVWSGAVVGCATVAVGLGIFGAAYKPARHWIAHTALPVIGKAVASAVAYHCFLLIAIIIVVYIYKHRKNNNANSDKTGLLKRP